MDSIKFLVRVNCMTYNHAPFITDAMNGFVMQQTSFPFVCIIVDDASTDGEPEVISRYMQDNFDLSDKTIAIEEETDDYRLMFARHKSNHNCYFVAVFLKYNHYSIHKPKHPYYMRWVGAKYIAICEGDDYWIDSSKLQKQIDFLEKHSGYSMCFHGVLQQTLGSIKPIKMMNNLEKREYTILEIYDNWLIPTASVVYLSNVKCITDNRFIFGDLPLFLSCSLVGKIFCVDSNPMGVYRRHKEGASVKRISYRKLINHHLALRERFPQIKDAVDNHITKYIVMYLFSKGGIYEKKEICLDLFKNPHFIFPSIMYIPIYIWEFIKSKVKQCNHKRQ